MDLTGITLDTGSAGDAALLVVGALAVIWGIKRAIAFFKG